MRLAVVTLLALAAASAGCRKSVVPACRTLCTCTPCTNNDLDACVEQARAEQRSAAAKGCAEAFDTFVDCFEDTFSCKNGGAIKCGHAQAALQTCSGSGNPFADVCQRSADHVNACVPGANQPPTEPCVGINACQAACIAAASCDELVGKDPNGPFNGCIGTCSGVPPPVP